MLSITGFLILTIFVVLIFFISCSNKSDKKKKKTTKTIQKEPFVNQIDYASSLLPTGPLRSDTEIENKEADIKVKNDDILALTALIDNTKQLISTKTTELLELRSDNSNLIAQFTTLLTNISSMNAYIIDFVTNNSFVDSVDIASSASALATFTSLDSKKSTLQIEINNLKTTINNNLVNYDESDIDTIEKIGTIQSGLIKSLNDIKSNYDTIFTKIKKNSSFVYFCGGDRTDLSAYPDYVQTYINGFNGNLCSDIDLHNVNSSVGDNNHFSIKTNNNIEIGRSICESRIGECIYEDRLDTPTSYFTSNYGYKFHQDKWPNEGSCEALSNIPPCFSHGTLSETACIGDTKLLYYIDSADPARYYSSNVNYTAELVPGETNEWICNLNEVNPNSNEENIASIARGNCEGNSSTYSAIYGNTSSYDCYSLTDALAKINAVGQARTDLSGTQVRSKTWSNTNNLDDTKGSCTIENTCRTETDVDNHVSCLNEDYTVSGTNFQCYELNAINSTAVANGKYRNTYSLGSWIENDKNMENGSCSNDSSCRTMYDIDAEISCAHVDNWNCVSFNFQPHASNIGSVRVVESDPASWHKSYQPLDYININDTTKGAGSCHTDSSCLNPALLNAEANCHNSDNYRCWNVNAVNHSANQTENKTYKYYEDAECITRTDCYTMEHALSIAEENCHASGGEDLCYKLKDDGSLELDNGIAGNIFIDGRKSRFAISDTQGTCDTRTCQTADDICKSKSVSCYTSYGVTESRNMEYHSNSNICVAPDGCSVEMCTYQSISDAEDGWVSNIKEDTINKEDTFVVPTSTNEEEVEVMLPLPSDSSSKLSYNDATGTISYNTKAIKSDGECPNPNDPTITNLGDYDQSVVVEHTRTIEPDIVTNVGCFGVTKKQVKYTIEPYGSRCPFNCVYYWGTDVNDPNDFNTECHRVCNFEREGGDVPSVFFDNVCEAPLCDEQGYRYPKRKTRKKNSSGAGCSGDGVGIGINGSDQTPKEVFEQRDGMRVNCDITACAPVDCRLGEPPVWGDCSKDCGVGTKTRDWTIATPPQHGGSSCESVLPPGETLIGEISDNTFKSSQSCNTDACNVDCVYSDYEYGPCTIRNINASCIPLIGQQPQKIGTRTIITQGTGTGTCDDFLSITEDCTSKDLPNICGDDDHTSGTFDVDVCFTDPELSTYQADCTWDGTSGTRRGEQRNQQWVYANNLDGRVTRDNANYECTLTCTSPSAPTYLSATQITSESFVLSWTPETNGDATLESYTISVSQDGVTPSWEISASSNTDNSITGLDSNTSYNVKVIKKFSSGPTVPVESETLSVTTTKLINKVNLHFPTFNLSDNNTDIIYFKFKIGGKTYIYNDWYNPLDLSNQEKITGNSWNFEEGGQAISAGYSGGINDLILNNFDLVNLDFVDIKVYPIETSPWQRPGPTGGYSAGEVSRTFRKTKDEIAEYIENVVPTNGIYTIRTMFMARTNTVELRHPR
uniref:Fibronectin type-III domain-containing protein n=1 Tax=viral metagenome TaxID=1070528 RepID=A0A6C0BRD7_9ZZZZ